MREILVCLLLFSSTFALEQVPVASCSNFDRGFFSGFHTVIGLLDAYEKEEISGIEIDLGTTGLYYDSTKGPNWWGYYFKPLSIPVHKESPRIPILTGTYEAYSFRGNRDLSKERCYYLIEKYIKIRPEILEEVEEFLEKNMRKSHFVGVQYRGTDKIQTQEANELSVEAAVLKVKQELFHMEQFQENKIFVATDDQFFLEAMQKEFGKRVCYFEMERSTDNRPIHFYGQSSGYIKGKMALLDCLVLSKSSFLFRTASNLSNVSLIFNPSLPSYPLNQGWGGERA